MEQNHSENHGGDTLFQRLYLPSQTKGITNTISVDSMRDEVPIQHLKLVLNRAKYLKIIRGLKIQESDYYLIVTTMLFAKYLDCQSIGVATLKTKGEQSFFWAEYIIDFSFERTVIENIVTIALTLSNERLKSCDTAGYSHPQFYYTFSDQLDENQIKCKISRQQSDDSIAFCLFVNTETVELKVLFGQDDVDVSFHHDLVENWHYLIENLERFCEIAMSAVPFVAPGQVERIDKYTGTKPNDFDWTPSICSLFSQVVRNTGNRIAVTCGKRQITYRELESYSNSLASKMQEEGVSYGEYIAICIPKSIELVVGILAILKCGAIYAPIDEQWPFVRLEEIFCCLRIRRCLVTPKTKMKAFENTETVCFTLDSLKGQPHRDISVSRITGKSSAYVNFSSGSTGKPKAILCNHAGVVRLVKKQEFIPFCSELVFLHASNITFDASTIEIWGPILNGGRCVINTTNYLTVKDIKHHIRYNCVNIIWLSSPLFNTFVDVEPTCFQGLNYLLIGGDIASKKHINEAYSINEDIQLVNTYGPTENTTFTTYYNIPRESHSYNNIPIGYPIRNTECFVLNSNMQIMPFNTVGELYVSGPGLAAGYPNNMSLSKEKFIVAPSWLGNKKVYRTGDFVRLDSLGALYFLGRSDNQVKINGFRVELEDIVQNMLTIKEINDSYVSVKKVGNEARMIAYYSASAELDKGIILKSLQSILPNYMIPHNFIWLKEFKLNANGKVDKTFLEELYLQRSKKKSSRKSTAYLNSLNVLIYIYKKVLKIENVDVNSSLQDLGGGSLSAIAIMELASGKNLQVSLPSLLDGFTLMEISNACLVDDNRATSTDDQLIEISPQQSRLFRTYDVDIERPCNFNVVDVFDLPVNRVEQKLKETLKTLSKIKFFLNVNFECKNEKIYVRDEAGFRSFVENLFVCKVKNKELQAAVAARVKKQGDKFFELTSDVMFELHCFLSSESAVCVVTISHLISDGYGVSMLKAVVKDVGGDSLDKLRANNLLYDYSNYAEEQNIFLEKNREEFVEKFINKGLHKQFFLPRNVCEKNFSYLLSTHKKVFCRRDELSRQPLNVEIIATRLSKYLERKFSLSRVCIGIPYLAREKSSHYWLLGPCQNMSYFISDVRGATNNQLLQDSMKTSVYSFNNYEEDTQKNYGLGVYPVTTVFINQVVSPLTEIPHGNYSGKLRKKYKEAWFDLNIYFQYINGTYYFDIEWSSQVFKPEDVHEIVNLMLTDI